MSLSPHFVSLRKGTAFGSQVFEDSLERDGLMNALINYPWEFLPMPQQLNMV